MKDENAAEVARYLESLESEIIGYRKEFWKVAAGAEHDTEFVADAGRDLPSILRDAAANLRGMLKEGGR